MIRLQPSRIFSSETSAKRTSRNMISLTNVEGGQPTSRAVSGSWVAEVVAGQKSEDRISRKLGLFASEDALRLRGQKR
jgi:hypothetical protein